ncbi:pilus assembly protein CpaE [Acidiphilium sp. PA]|uniref:AAA family ATPase n=1 Tax=Acidiphilium sp. PA TaxID=2871705 RepID=UPI002244671B|nr:pilus assembly protein CpaE [Acidiphilium sp. PA]MCW8305601.1 pilus assembly protein CpaE [Acidiphilium sp. PA]
MTPVSAGLAERPDFIGFVRDTETAHVLRAALGPAFPAGLALHQLSFRQSIEWLGGIATPRTILIDISGEDQPFTAMVQLEAVVDPGTRVLVIGENRSVSFYRTLTRNLGVKEYLPKPLDAGMVQREFLPWATGDEPAAEPARGGAVVALCGAGGGVGVTTIAANLAWLIGGETRRHTILLDADLHRGSAALFANVPPSTGLRHALEAPDRIDPLLIERAAHPATERLHVLAAEEPLTEQWTHRIGGGRALAVALRQRYNFVLADIPAHPLGFAGEILALAQQRILIIEATAQSVHLAKSWMALPAGAMQTSRPVLVVNKYQKRRGLTAAQIEAELSTPVAVTVPDMGPHAARAADLGESLIAAKGKFRDAILQLARIIGAAPGGPA